MATVVFLELSSVCPIIRRALQTNISLRVYRVGKNRTTIFQKCKDYFVRICRFNWRARSPNLGKLASVSSRRFFSKRLPLGNRQKPQRKPFAVIDGCPFPCTTKSRAPYCPTHGLHATSLQHAGGHFGSFLFVLEGTSLAESALQWPPM